jgi:hypothetical protein
VKHSKSILAVFLAAISCLLLVSLVTPQIAKAHSGRTDSSGGHNCNVGACAGTYHYHNGGGGSSSGGLSEAAQARIAGADFARTDNRSRIESSATAEGSYQGKTDGLAGTSSPYAENDSNEHCSQEIKFTNAVSATYKEAFQSLYTTTCISIYGDVYRTAYQAANVPATQAFEEDKARDLAAKTAASTASQENNDSWWGWLILGGFIGLPIIGAGWESIKKHL